MTRPGRCPAAVRSPHGIRGCARRTGHPGHHITTDHAGRPDYVWPAP